jgi:hypothetical protein
MRLAFTAAIAALALSACATAAPPSSGANNVSDGRDCAVMTAILKQQYKVEPNSRLHIQRGDPKAADQSGFRITCDFKAAGIPIEDYDYSHQNTSREDFQGWISFAKPTYPRPTTAVIETGYLIGPLAGAGQTCTVQSGVAGWTVNECKMSWVS